MLGDVILWSVLLVPLAIGLAWRVSVSHVFFSLMAGELLARYFGNDLDALLHVHGPGHLAIIFVPMLVTGYLLRRTVSRRRLLVQVVPFLITGLICAAFVLPLLPEAAMELVRGTYFGNVLLNLHRTIIGSMVVLQLISLWLVHRQWHGHHRHGGHL